MSVDLESLKTLLWNKLREHHGEAIQEIIEYRGELTVVIDRAAVVEVCTLLRDDPDFQFNMLSYMTCLDNKALGADVRFESVYMLFSIPKSHRVRIRAAIPEDDPTISSVCGVWPGANFMEREAYDMFGVVFQGHPDLRRILMPDDWEGHPLRKDFPLGGVKSFYLKRASNPHAGEPEGLVPRLRKQESDI